jgi:hypothetical protein
MKPVRNSADSRNTKTLQLLPNSDFKWTLKLNELLRRKKAIAYRNILPVSVLAASQSTTV